MTARHETPPAFQARTRMHNSCIAESSGIGPTDDTLFSLQAPAQLNCQQQQSCGSRGIQTLANWHTTNVRHSGKSNYRDLQVHGVQVVVGTTAPVAWPPETPAGWSHRGLDVMLRLPQHRIPGDGGGGFQDSRCVFCCQTSLVWLRAVYNAPWAGLESPVLSLQMESPRRAPRLSNLRRHRTSSAVFGPGGEERRLQSGQRASGWRQRKR